MHSSMATASSGEANDLKEKRPTRPPCDSLEVAAAIALVHQLVH
jgi:hypothetical protein